MNYYDILFAKKLAGEGGGGGGEITPIVSVKVIKNDVPRFNINGFLEIKDNHLYYTRLNEIEVDPYTFNTVAWSDGEMFYVYFVDMFDPETSLFGLGDISSVTECVNCTYDSDENALIITDPTQNASATVNLEAPTE